MFWIPIMLIVCLIGFLSYTWNGLTGAVLDHKYKQRYDAQSALQERVCDEQMEWEYKNRLYLKHALCQEIIEKFMDDDRNWEPFISGNNACLLAMAVQMADAGKIPRDLTTWLFQFRAPDNYPINKWTETVRTEDMMLDPWSARIMQEDFMLKLQDRLNAKCAGVIAVCEHLPEHSWTSLDALRERHGKGCTDFNTHFVFVLKSLWQDPK